MNRIPAVPDFFRTVYSYGPYELWNTTAIVQLRIIRLFPEHIGTTFSW